MKNIIASFVILLLTACSSLDVSPWERQNLAKPEMELNSSPMHPCNGDQAHQLSA